jgi:hypothetical protein
VLWNVVERAMGQIACMCWWAKVLKPFSSKISDQLGMKFLAATDIGKLLPW